MSALIVSDYDGTIKINNNVNININLIKSLLDDNIKFMISTGRVYKSIKEEINNNNILFSYVSCANGNILFNNKFELEYNTFVNQNIIKKLKPFYKYILDIEKLDSFGNKTENNNTEYFVHLVNELKVRRKLIDLLLSLSDYDYCTDGNNKFDIHIFNHTNKIKTIEIVRNRLKISKDDVYTIGDGPNDIDMIQKYNGNVIGNYSKELNNIRKYDSFDLCVNNISYRLKKKVKND